MLWRSLREIQTKRIDLTYGILFDATMKDADWRAQVAGMSAEDRDIMKSHVKREFERDREIN